MAIGVASSSEGVGFSEGVDVARVENGVEPLRLGEGTW